MVGVAAPELVVINHFDAGLRQERFHRFQVVMGKARAAVQQQDLDRTGADALGPDLVFAAGDRNHPDAGGADAGWVQAIRLGHGDGGGCIHGRRGACHAGIQDACGNCGTADQKMSAVHKR